MDRGIYIAVFRLDAERPIAVGRLGRFRFAPGLYFYVGTAQRNLQARLERHARADKPRRWHIDYLSVHARMLGAITLDAGRQAECETAAKLAALLPRPVAGFGASDCRCAGHLFFETGGVPAWPHAATA